MTDQHFPSLKWMWALRDSDVPPRLKDLALLHLSYADERGCMFPSVETLRLSHVNDNDLPLSKRTLQYRRAELVRLGWLELVEKGDGRGKASVYRLSFPSETVQETVQATLSETVQAHCAPSETSSDRSVPRERSLYVVDDEMESSPVEAGDSFLVSRQLSPVVSPTVLNNTQSTTDFHSSTTSTVNRGRPVRPQLGTIEAEEARMQGYWLEAWCRMNPSELPPLEVLDWDRFKLYDEALKLGDEFKRLSEPQPDW